MNFLSRILFTVVLAGTLLSRSSGVEKVTTDEHERTKAGNAPGVIVVSTTSSAVLSDSKPSLLNRPCVPPPSGMVGWWSGDNNTFDLSGSNNSAQLVGGVTYSSSGMVDQGFVFDGVDDYVEVAISPTLAIADEMTVDAWVKVNSTTSTYQTVFDNNGVNSNGMLISVQPNTNSLALYINGNPEHAVTDVYDIGQFTHVAVTTKLGVSKVYKNGVLIATLSTSTLLPSTISTRFGSRRATTEFFGGEIDEIEIFNRELSELEIAEIYAAGAAGKCKDVCPPKPITVDVSLCDKWNIISLPAVVADNTLTTVFPSVISQAFSWGSAYQFATQLDACNGYWIKVSAPVVQPIVGTLICNSSCSLQQGWNLIGGISFPVDVAAIETDPPGIIVSSYWSYCGGSTGPHSVLEPGRGYWVKTSSAGTLYLPNNSAKVSASVAQNILDQFQKLVVTDDEGYRQALYFGSNPEKMVDGKSCEMPPPPPEGIFDVRFASQRLLEIFEKGEGESRIDLSFVRYPITISLESPEGGELLDVAIADAFGGALFANASLAQGSTITFSDPRIKSLVLKVSGSSSKIPSEFALRQNHPNPFNPASTIEFDLPRDANVTMKVYDPIGREVATIANHMQYVAGRHSVHFDASSLVSGVYFYRIIAQGARELFTDVRKMLLMK